MDEVNWTRSLRCHEPSFRVIFRPHPVMKLVSPWPPVTAKWGKIKEKFRVCLIMKAMWNYSNKFEDLLKWSVQICNPITFNCFVRRNTGYQDLERKMCQDQQTRSRECFNTKVMCFNLLELLQFLVFKYAIQRPLSVLYVEIQNIKLIWDVVYIILYIDNNAKVGGTSEKSFGENSPYRWRKFRRKREIYIIEWN